MKYFKMSDEDSKLLIDKGFKVITSVQGPVMIKSSPYESHVVYMDEYGMYTLASQGEDTAWKRESTDVRSLLKFIK